MTVATELVAIADALDVLAEAIRNAGGATDAPLNQSWQFAPALDRYEIANAVDSLAKRVRDSGVATLSADDVGMLADYPARLNALKDGFVPNIYNGNAPASVNPILTTIYALDTTLQRFMAWDADPHLPRLPNKLARRLRSIAATIDNIEHESGGVTRKIEAITAAYDAADRLDATLEELRESNERLAKLEKEATEAARRINVAHETSDTLRDHLVSKAAEADALIAQCEEAYRATTSKGLAGAFEVRAQKLNVSMKWWVGGLACALISGAILGAVRVAALSSVLASESPNWGAVALHMVLSIVSVGAPLWFAWIATRQIGQQFRLAEDYAFKASVAKAYEGYRREAAKIDEEFAARLFASALTRLEEAPLRVMDGAQVEGSPWHELIKSAGFQTALERSSAFCDSIIGMAKDAQVKMARRNGHDSAPEVSAPKMNAANE